MSPLPTGLNERTPAQKRMVKIMVKRGRKGFLIWRSAESPFGLHIRPKRGVA